MLALITGSDGQLGRELKRTRPGGWEIAGLNRTALDVTDSAAVQAALQKHQPDLVINTAAYTGVDKAESEEDKAHAVNAEGAANIAKAAENCRSRLIHISTDFVFDGRKSQPYLPEDKPNPISIYGASKLHGEDAVLAETGGKALILRTGWLYSSYGSNFVKTMLQLLSEKDEIRVVADQIGTPTWARDLAKAIWRFAGIPDALGIYHWTDAGVAGWYDFAAAVQEEAMRLGILNTLIPVIPVRTEDYPTAAKRPSYSVLDKTATWQTLGYYSLHWRRSLQLMLEEMRAEG